MPPRTLEYPRTPVNRVNRYNARETYDLEQIHGIVNEASVLNVSFNTPDPSNPFVVTLPMVGVAASYEHPSAGPGEPLDVYLHGYVSARMMNLARPPKPTSTTTETQNERSEAPKEEETSGSEAPPTPKGLAVTISATKVDGLVLSLTPYTHDINYRSATLYGYANIVTDEEEKLWAMEQVTNSVVADRWRFTRVPPVPAEMQSTSILRVSVVSGSGKVRVGGPRDEPKDFTQQQLRDTVWTGVVPVYECYGEPVPSKTNLIEKVPDHVAEYAREMTSKNERYAADAIADTSQDY
jgi:nitroimidazol reductase NimA-like FMN-containing flavoprotein (pyridoxamine 5'-phosphate oxidase superfamily)